MDEISIQEAIQSGLIDMEEIQKKLELQKKENIIKNHPYSIWIGKDQYWRTYVHDETRRNHRKLVKKKKKESLYEFLYEFYDQKITLRDLYKRWLKYKGLHTNRSSYIARIIADWNRFYEFDEIADKNILTLSEVYLDEWLHGKIKEYNMTKTCFYNMSLVLRQSLLYAKSTHIISYNPMVDVKINTKMFRHVKKPKDETQVFLNGEVPKIFHLALDEYEETGREDCLAIALNFMLGLRSGELAAIKEEDIEDEKYLHIQRMEVKEYDTSNPIKAKFIGRNVVEYTKTEEGDRYVYMNHVVRTYINELILSHKKTGNDQKYIFLKNGKRIESYFFNGRLEKYCRAIHIPEKRTHKIRKTFISSLIDHNINLNEIRKIVGHADERTTLKNYCYNKTEKNEQEIMLEDCTLI